MAFDDFLKSNASIMEAYKKMYQKDSGARKEEVIEEAKVTKAEIKEVEKELEKVVDKIEEGFGDHRDAYAMHRSHGSSRNPDHKFAIVHKLDHSKVAKTFPDRKSAVEHLDNDESLQGTHRVVGTDSIRLHEEADDEETRFNSWADNVKKAFPGKQLKFKNRIESGTHTTSAEVSGEDRSYGVWDHDKSEGHVFHESKTVEESVEALAASPEPTSGHYCAYGRKFATHCFPTPHAANEFMASERGKEYGYIGMSDDGQYHVAHMNDAGEVSSVE